MNDAQFQQLLHHIDGIGKDVFGGAIVAAFILYIAISVHSWTRK